ncbi:hypothetical protein FO519_005765 [Halicephalobus sp. NKZ332]|nr:hypothetical protein FO519_005765 [Halicephalobus sp. NKZ332]
MKIKTTVCPEVRTTRTKIVGFHDCTFYIAPDKKGSESGSDAIEIYSVHVLVPKSWKLISRIDAREIAVLEFSLSPDGEFIYCLFIGILRDNDIPTINVIKISTTDEEVLVYSLNPESGDTFEQVFIQQVGIQCGKEGLYMFDRTLAMGRIPFWEIVLEDKDYQFTIHPNPIPAHSAEYQCNRFPLMFNPDNREVIKVSDSDMLLIFDGAANEWNPYYPDEDNQFDISSAPSRGIQETYGRYGQRFGAIDTKMTFFGAQDNCMLKVSERGMHYFYSFNIDRDRRTYRLLKRAEIPQLKDSFMYRLASTGKRIAVISRQTVIFILTQPTTLKELAFWGVQKQLATESSAGCWTGGITEGELKKMCQIKYNMPLI